MRNDELELQKDEYILLEARSATMRVKSLVYTEEPPIPPLFEGSSLIFGSMNKTKEEMLKKKEEMRRRRDEMRRRRDEMRRKSAIYEKHNYRRYGTLYLTNLAVLVSDSWDTQRFPLNKLRGFPNSAQVYREKGEAEKFPKLRFDFEDYRVAVEFSDWDLCGSAAGPKVTNVLLAALENKPEKFISRWVEETQNACVRMAGKTSASAKPEPEPAEAKKAKSAHGYCMKCGGALAANARFCRYCGASVPKSGQKASGFVSLNCPNCQAIMSRADEPDTYICTHCNSKFMYR